jgi:hypothetical protein
MIVVLAAVVASATQPLQSLADPSIVLVSPPGGSTQGGYEVQCSGTGFGATPGSVHVGGRSASIHQWRDDLVVVVCPEGDPGSAAIVVTPSGGTSATGEFRYDDPVITSVSPNHGPLAGGTTVVIGGRNFGTSTAARTVSFGDNAANLIEYRGHLQLVVASPPSHAPGVFPVWMSFPDATSNARPFNYEGTLPVEAAQPDRIALRQNRPNPVASTTTISFDLVESGDFSLWIADVGGRIVRRFQGSAGAGTIHVRWDGTDQRGQPVACGVYLYQLAARGRATPARKLIVTR